MPYRIYDNENNEWVGVGFYDFEFAENHVIKELGDEDFNRYSIFQLISGY